MVNFFYCFENISTLLLHSHSEIFIYIWFTQKKILAENKFYFHFGGKFSILEFPRWLERDRDKNFEHFIFVSPHSWFWNATNNAKSLFSNFKLIGDSKAIGQRGKLERLKFSYAYVSKLWYIFINFIILRQIISLISFIQFHLELNLLCVKINVIDKCFTSCKKRLSSKNIDFFKQFFITFPTHFLDQFSVLVSQEIFNSEWAFNVCDIFEALREYFYGFSLILQ